jgi:hypothetical protein
VDGAAVSSANDIPEIGVALPGRESEKSFVSSRHARAAERDCVG